jgi:hypothetical protein
LQSQSAKSAGTAQTMPPTKEIERDVNFWTGEKHRSQSSV